MILKKILNMYIYNKIIQWIEIPYNYTLQNTKQQLGSKLEIRKLINISCKTNLSMDS